MTANTAAYPQPAQFELFRRLIPALKTACQLHARFEQLRDTIKYQSAVMDNGIYPVWLVDHGGKILYASAHAERYLRANTRLSWYSGAIRCASIPTAKTETGYRAGHPDGRAAEGRVCYTAGRQPKPILVIPTARLAGVACVIIPEPFLTGSALMELFNVKPAENAVAELLVRGMTPDECAYIWAYLSPPSEPTLAPCTGKPTPVIRQNYC